MLIWQGFGFLAVVFPILGYVLTVKVLQAILGAPYTDSHAWPGALGTLLGAAAVWFLARSPILNKPGRSLVDPKTGETVVLKKKHTFFFIPMDYFAGIMLLVALGMLIFKSGSPL